MIKCRKSHTPSHGFLILCVARMVHPTCEISVNVNLSMLAKMEKSSWLSTHTCFSQKKKQQTTWTRECDTRFHQPILFFLPTASILLMQLNLYLQHFQAPGAERTHLQAALFKGSACGWINLQDSMCSTRITFYTSFYKLLVLSPHKPMPTT